MQFVMIPFFIIIYTMPDLLRICSIVRRTVKSAHYAEYPTKEYAALPYITMRSQERLS